ncbi:MAG TPA: hypothetical protein VFI17_03520 [Solirubrobacterales bacterium]|nr:hypothetical protein [Solirubrobacterales bacterium]
MSEEAQIFNQATQPAAPAQQTVTATPPVQPPVQMPAEITPQAPSAAAEEMPEEWPVKGYAGPQPWEVSRPPALAHDRRLLISGSAGDEVLELCACLGRLGYETSVSRGENALAVFGAAERTAVERFRADYGVQEDPAIISATTPDAVGPWTWEALFRLVNRVEGGE